MEKYFVDYETLKFLKRLGFNEPELNEGSLFKYNGNYISGKGIMWQQVKEWLWEKYNIQIKISGKKKSGFYFFRKKLYNGCYRTPMQAEIEGIKVEVESLFMKKLYSETAVAVTPINTSANGA